jgi:hypothetical protein
MRIQTKRAYERKTFYLHRDAEDHIKRHTLVPILRACRHISGNAERVSYGLRPFCEALQPHCNLPNRDDPNQLYHARPDEIV